MSVAQAAHALGRSRWAIYKVLERGALRAYKAGPQWLIPTLEVLRIIYFHPGNRCHVWACEVAPKKFKIFPSSIGHTDDLATYTYEESLAELCPPDAGEQLAAPDAALQLQPEFRSIARQLERRDRSLQDDLVQEMSLAVLQQKRTASLKWFLYCGVYAARNYLKRERFRGGISLDQISQLAVESAALADETLVQALLDDGCPASMIEEILDCRLLFDEPEVSSLKSTQMPQSTEQGKEETKAQTSKQTNDSHEDRIKDEKKRKKKERRKKKMKKKKRMKRR